MLSRPLCLQSEPLCNKVAGRFLMLELNYLFPDWKFSYLCVVKGDPYEKV